MSSTPPRRTYRPRRAASVVCAGFEGTVLTDELKRHVERGIRAFILFARNVETPSQVAQLCFSLKEFAGDPTLICVDQEGGSVRRLREGFSEIPSMREVADGGGPELAAEVGALLARELRAVGIDWDLAPVLDVDTNPNNPVIGQRAFSPSPEQVITCGLALARALERGGVASCAKHFPGHGDTELDSHLALPRVRHDWERLSSVELAPFRAYAEAGLAAMMTAHVVFDGLAPGCPATLSRAILTELLRDRWGYPGLLVTDDLNMKAIRESWGVGEAARLSIQAGADLLLVCRGEENVVAAVQGLSDEDCDGALSIALDRASRSTLGFISRWARPAEEAADLSLLAQGLSGTFGRQSSADPTRDGAG